MPKRWQNTGCNGESMLRKHTHIFTRQCYRDVKKLTEELKADVAELQEQKEATQEEINRAKKEIQTEKLKEVAIIAATNIAESVVSLFGSNNVKTVRCHSVENVCCAISHNLKF